MLRRVSFPFPLAMTRLKFFPEAALPQTSKSFNTQTSSSFTPPPIFEVPSHHQNVRYQQGSCHPGSNHHGHSRGHATTSNGDTGLCPTNHEGEGLRICERIAQRPKTGGPLPQLRFQEPPLPRLRRATPQRGAVSFLPSLLLRP